MSEIFNNRLLFPHYFLEIFVEGQGCDGRVQSRDRSRVIGRHRGIPQYPR